MVTLTQLFAQTRTSSDPSVPALATSGGAALPQDLPMSVLLPRKGNGHHPHHHHLQLVTHPEQFDWKSVGQGELRASLTPRSHSGARQIALTIGTDTVGTLESLPAALLYEWVTNLNSRGYDVQVDIYTAGDNAPPQLLTKSASSVAYFLHTLLDH